MEKSINLQRELTNFDMSTNTSFRTYILHEYGHVDTCTPTYKRF